MGYLLMIVATLIWGVGFVGTRWTLVDYSPTWSNALRFAIAATIILPYIVFTVKKVNFKPTLVGAMLLFLGLEFQTFGVAHTTLAKSGFLTVFYAFFTPLLMVLFFKETIKPAFWSLMFVAFVGIALLCDLNVNNFNFGDLCILISALCFSLHIVWIDRKAQNEPAILFNFWQTFLIAIIACSWAFLSQGPVSIAPVMEFSKLGQASAISGFLIVSVFSSLVAFTIQVKAQKMLKAHIVSLIFLLESVFAAAFGYLFFGETMSTMAVAGALLVVLAVALVPRFTRAKKELTNEWFDL